MLADLRSGDTLVVWRLDRLGRNLADLVRIVSDLRGKGVGFESLTERIDTVTATGELVFHLFASLAQFECNLVRERTRAGLASARARGRKGGRPPKLGPKQLREIRVLLRDPGVTQQRRQALWGLRLVEADWIIYRLGLFRKNHGTGVPKRGQFCTSFPWHAEACGEVRRERSPESLWVQLARYG